MERRQSQVFEDPMHIGDINDSESHATLLNPENTDPNDSSCS